jgi:hypothetical protein
VAIPSRLLRNCLRNEQETLQLPANDITASVREIMKERFPKQDLRRVVNAISRLCKKAVRLDFSETPDNSSTRAQKHSRGVRV